MTTKYWVVVTRIKVNSIETYFEYGDEFPELKDKEKMKLLLDTGILSRIRPKDTPAPIVLPINHFKPSQPYVESKVQNEKEKKKKEK